MAPPTLTPGSFAAGGPATLLESAHDVMRPRFYAISERIQESHDTFTLIFDCTDPFNFDPGQFNMLYVPGYGEVPISISGDRNKPERLVHTIRAVGGVTRALERAEVGDWIGIRGPFGVPWPVADLAPPSEAALQAVVIAGGIGLAPLRPVIYSALDAGTELFLVYGARTPADLLFLAELEAWAKFPGVRCVVTVDRGDADWQANTDWSGNTGVVTKYIPQLNFSPERVRAYTCGPEIMMRFSARELIKAGVTPEAVFVSMERNMKCGIGHCGHCQLGPHLLCKTGPVLDYPEASRWMTIREL